MTHILVVEGNSESLVSVSSSGQIAGAAEKYAQRLSLLSDGLDMSITRPHLEYDPAPPPDWDVIDAVVFTGSGVNWSADDSEAAPMRAVMTTALNRGKPVFGSCFGMQLGVAVIGGKIGANPAGAEVLMARNIQQTQIGTSHPMYAGKPHIFDALCMHRDDVLALDSSLEMLSTNSHCAIQSVASNSQTIHFWGVQYHPELRFDDVARYIHRSDVQDFAQLDRISACLGRQVVDPDEVIEDFTLLSCQPENPALIKKYEISHSVTSYDIHTIELSNWLNFVQHSHTSV